jgi:outer membrane receptor protein involved in Fe transport
MKDQTNVRSTMPCFARSAMLVIALLFAPLSGLYAQGVTTGALIGVVTDNQMRPVVGASVIAIHEPSGTTYEGTTRADGRYQIPGMRVGGPYSITVNFVGTGTAFEPQTTMDVTVNLGVPADVNFTVRPIAVQETVSVVATVDPIFSSGRTGASTSVDRETIGLIPTFQGRISDVIRLSPQASGVGFAGQDGRMNNITVDGSSFNATFGVSSSQPGDRTGVAPISLDAVEQIQINVAPFDVRQGSFIGAGVNTVTRSGANQLSGTFYHNFRNQDWVGTDAKGVTVNPGTFTFRNTGGSASGPIVRNRLFAFGNYEDQIDKRPLWSTRANQGGEPATSSVSRVLESDLTSLSSFLQSNFDYATGPFNNLDDETPAKRFLIRSDFNINNSNKVNFRYNYLDSFTDVQLSSSTSALNGRSSSGSTFLTFQNSNYKILENIKSGIGEWNTVLGSSIANSLQAGYTTQDESRGSRGSIFPLIDIREGGTPYTSFGFEPFTLNNELRYNTFQVQDNLSRFTTNHSFTLGGYVEKYHAENVFYGGCCPQGAWQYNSLADFYADANGYLANPNRTTTTTPAARFQVRWNNIPGIDKPLQLLDVWYQAYYAQDEWRPRSNFTLTAGIRADVSAFDETGYPNPAADALTFRNENGEPVQYSTGTLPGAKILWSPRVGFNWDVANDQTTQVRGGSGVFSGRPAYVWIANQIGNSGVLLGERIVDAPNTANFPFNPNADVYKPAATGVNASSYALNVTDPEFKFPQIWRSNIALDRKLPGGVVSTTEYLYAKDINAVYYINANLPAAQSAFSGVDARPRWVGTSCGAPTAGPCVTRLNNEAGNQVTNAFVLLNTDVGHQWTFSQSFNKNFDFGLSVRGAYSYGEAYNVSDPESTATTSFSRNSTFTSPNDATPSLSMWSPGHRVFALATFSREYFSFGATSISAFWEMKPSTFTGSTRVSYTLAGDANGDTVSANDLIYVPRDQSEMNFVPFTAGANTFTAADQAAAFDKLISNDDYLNSRRGQYAERNGGRFPMVRNLDLTIAQQIFTNVGGKRNAFQIRADFLNFGNMLNSNWGVGWRSVPAITNGNQVQLLTNPAADAQGRLSYRLATANNQLIPNIWQSSSTTGDVYQFQLSLRYSFN